MIGATIAHYRITEKLGEGGMGVVYKAEDTKLDRTVALKFLAAHLLNDEEAKAAAALDHPNICTVYEIGEADGKTYLSMAFIEGEPLEAPIERGPLPLKEALDIGRQIADGLEAAHEKGVIHRDIKPANVMVDAKGRATIMDFGLARLTEASRLTKANQTMGTAAYMSPEQAQGIEVDGRTDLWALGCVLHEMVAGARPFKGEYDQALLYEIVHEQPPPLTGARAGVPMELEFVVGKCLAKGAAERYQSAKEIAVDLRTLSEKLKSGRSTVLGTTNLAAGQTRNHAEALASDPVSIPRSSQRVLQAVAGVCALVALTLGFLYFSETPAQLPALKTSILPPEGTSFYGTIGPAALSLDGRRIAFAAITDNQPRLWIRDLDSLTAGAIPASEGARFPFWSPDSGSVGFFAGSDLKRVEAAGAPSGRLPQGWL